MTPTDKIAALRKRSYSLEALPDIIRVPALGARREEVIRPIEHATLDDISFAILALDAESDALCGRLNALRRLHTMARKEGALGADRILDAIPPEKESK
jgi:RNase adaptor protein for sRNA GlmZ degradation